MLINYVRAQYQQNDYCNSFSCNQENVGIVLTKTLLTSPNQIRSFFTGTSLDVSSMLNLECDVLVPASVSGVITEDNAHKLNCKVVAEAANVSLNTWSPLYMNLQGACSLYILTQKSDFKVLYSLDTHHLALMLWQKIRDWMIDASTSLNSHSLINSGDVVHSNPVSHSQIAEQTHVSKPGVLDRTPLFSSSHIMRKVNERQRNHQI